MENAGTVVFGFYLLLLSCIISAVFFAAAHMLRKAQGGRAYHTLRGICFALGAVCALPPALVAGYLLYFYIATRLPWH